MHRTRRTLSYLPMRQVLALADKVAEKHGLQAPRAWQRQMALESEGEIARILTMRETLPATLFPMVLENKQGMLWVDSQYVAYQLGAGDVRYVYISLYHIMEERITGHLPRDIVKEFERARRGMRAKGRKYYVDKEYEREEMTHGAKNTSEADAYPCI